MKLRGTIAAAYAIRRDHNPSLVNMTILYEQFGDLEKAHDTALEGLRVNPGDARLQRMLMSINRRLHERPPGTALRPVS